MLAPLSRIGPWRGCLGTYHFPWNSSMYCLICSASRERTMGRCQWRSTAAVRYTPSWATSPPGSIVAFALSGWKACWVNQDGTVHILNFLFSIPVCLYSSYWQLFSCFIELTREGIPPVFDLGIDAFGVWRAVRVVLRVDHVRHL